MSDFYIFLESIKDVFMNKYKNKTENFTEFYFGRLKIAYKLLYIIMLYYLI